METERLSEYLWEIPIRKTMRVPARFYTSEEMYDDLFKDKSLKQLINTASLPGATRYVLGMPDMHQGYGICIGGVVATDVETGVISPGAVGFDQGCGVRVLTSDLTVDEIDVSKLITQMYRRIPSGLGQGHKKKISHQALVRVLEEGTPYLVSQGYGEKGDIVNCESQGAMKGANASFVSSKAKERGLSQVGTLGSGNHFVEIQVVEKAFGGFDLKKGQVLVMIHTGSRGLGHQNCTDYLQVARKAMRRYNISLPDSNLASIPLRSDEGQRFLGAMRAAINYAFCNRQALTHYVRQAWKGVQGSSDLKLLYDVNHNTAKIEEYEIEGQMKKLCVHRKGATRSFPGQPVLVPGSMGTSSYIMVGKEKSEESFYSVCHGAGRTMSRTQARKKVSGSRLVKDLKGKGIIVKSRSHKGLAEEAPLAYKDVGQVVDVIEGAGLAGKVAKLRPLAVMKGE